MIDAVFTWVDGDDPAHAAARALHLGETRSPETIDAGAHRYRDGDELRYALRALEAHAPWIGRVFLVTCGQRPSWLAPGQLELVTHEQIFPDPAHLPTFNSCAIEMHLHRIPGLSPTFLYFNDDFFLGAPVAPSDFMTREGQRLYLTPALVPDAGAQHVSLIDGREVAMPPLPEVFLASLRGVNRLLGGRPRRFIAHVPCLVETRIWEEVIARFPAEIARTSAHRFRTVDDVAFGYTYTHHRLDRQLPGDEIVDWNELSIPLSMPAAGLRSVLEHVLRLRPKFFCLQDEVGHDEAKATLARSFLERMFPRPSRFERR